MRTYIEELIKVELDLVDDHFCFERDNVVKIHITAVQFPDKVFDDRSIAGATTVFERQSRIASEPFRLNKALPLFAR